MSDLQDGRYFIQPATAPGPKPYVGANYGPGPLIPVTLGGEDNVWTVKRVKDGIYTLILERTGRFRYSEKDKEAVVVGVEHPGTHWVIRGLDGGPYIIEVHNTLIPKSVWAVDDFNPMSPVVLRPFPVAPPEPHHLWNFLGPLPPIE